jgi:uncharacterized protein HemX
MITALHKVWLYIKLYLGWIIGGIALVVGGLFFIFTKQQQSELKADLSNQSRNYRKQIEDLQNISNDRRVTEQRLEKERDEKLTTIEQKRTEDLNKIQDTKQEQIDKVVQQTGEDPNKIAEEFSKVFGMIVDTKGNNKQP